MEILSCYAAREVGKGELGAGEGNEVPILSWHGADWKKDGSPSQAAPCYFSWLQAEHECYQILFFLIRKVKLQYKIEKFNRVGKGQQSAIMMIRRGILDPPNSEGFDRSVWNGVVVIDHLWLIETLKLEILHLMVGVGWCRMAVTAFCLAKKELFPAKFLLCSLFFDESPGRVQFWSWRKIEHVLHLGHHSHLTCPVRQIDAFFGCNNVISVKVSCSLLKFGEIFYRA